MSWEFKTDQDKRLSLISTEYPEWLPLTWDFCEKKFLKRLKLASRKSEALLRAMGKQLQGAAVIDATAGSGVDALLIASAGCRVWACERNHALYLLLKNALERAAQHSALGPLITNIRLERIDALIKLREMKPEDRPDIVYCDPMFPKRRKCAQSRKAMTAFQQIAGEDPDALQLVQTALQTARKRVVIKQPRLSPFLLETKPNHQVVGKACRFDVYIV